MCVNIPYREQEGRCIGRATEQVARSEYMPNDYEALLDAFGRLPARVERLPTFMEIAGYPHYENACSNVLAFYLDPEQPHGLGTLVLAALARAGDISQADEGVAGNVSVEREVVTGAGNRIDIVIESDTHAIVIENKIRARVNNPLADYAEYQDSRTPEGREKHRFLLTLAPTAEGSVWGFKNITYTGFVAEIRETLGRHVSSADTRYLTLLLDFLNTLENLHKETRMDARFFRLLSERSDEIEALLGEVKAFRGELRRKVRALGSLVDVEGYPDVRQWFWREETSLRDVLVHDISVAPDLPIYIDTAVYPSGWEISVWLRGASGIEPRLSELLRRLDIAVDGDFVHARFAYEENLELIAPVVQDLVDKLALAGNATG